MNKTDKIENLNVSTTELATVLGISVRRVQQLIQDGTIPKISRGKFPLCGAVDAYIAKLTARTLSDEAARVEMDKRTAEARLKTAKAKMAELEVNELMGKMHRAEDVKAITYDMVYTIRGALLALPSRVSTDVAATENPAECATIIKKEIQVIMNELARYKYDPEKYAERVRERNDTKGNQEVNEE